MTRSGQIVNSGSPSALSGGIISNIRNRIQSRKSRASSGMARAGSIAERRQARLGIRQSRIADRIARRAKMTAARASRLSGSLLARRQSRLGLRQSRLADRIARRSVESYRPSPGPYRSTRSNYTPPSKFRMPSRSSYTAPPKSSRSNYTAAPRENFLIDRLAFAYGDEKAQEGGYKAWKEDKERGFLTKHAIWFDIAILVVALGGIGTLAYFAFRKKPASSFSSYEMGGI
jgi:hypothetical protein